MEQAMEPADSGLPLTSQSLFRITAVPEGACDCRSPVSLGSAGSGLRPAVAGQFGPLREASLAPTASVADFTAKQVPAVQV